MLIIKIETEEEKEQIIVEKTNQGYTLVEIQNVIEGNFLGFEGPDWTPPEIEPDLKMQIKTLQSENAALIMQLAGLESLSQQQAVDTAALVLQNAILETTNQQLAEDHASLIMELSMKGVL